MSSIKAWILASRPFALPWILVNTLVGVKLAGFDLSAWLLSFAIVSSILTACHYMNNWRDYVRGLDRLEKGSVAKPYTAASQLIPSGQFTVREAKLATAGFLLLGVALYILFAPIRLDTLLLLILGIVLALTYTDFFKPHGLGELALFLGHGFGTCVFAYSIVRPITLEGIVAGVILGMWASTMYTLDQWQDVETDFLRRIRNTAQLIAKANMSISTFYYFAVTAIVTMHIAMTFMGLLPTSTLKAVLLLPYLHLTGVFLEASFEKGMVMMLFGMWLYALLMAV